MPREDAEGQTQSRKTESKICLGNLTEMGLDPEWTFFSAPANYPQKCLHPSPDVNGAHPSLKASFTPATTQGFPGPLILRKELLQECQRHSGPMLNSSKPHTDCKSPTCLVSKSQLVLSPESTSGIQALGPSRQGAPRLRSTEVDAPFHNFSKSQGSQQRHSRGGCASTAGSLGQLASHSSEADRTILSFSKPTPSPDHNGDQSP